jgi:DNA-binding NtrC family response regulator
VLVLEDNLDLIELITVVLRLGGFNSVGFAPSWANALTQIKDREPRFIVVDAEMLEGISENELISRFDSMPSHSTVIALLRWGYHKPRWAQAHLSRTSIAELPSLLERLVGALPPDRREPASQMRPPAAS